MSRQQEVKERRRTVKTSRRHLKFLICQQQEDPGLPLTCISSADARLWSWPISFSCKWFTSLITLSRVPIANSLGGQ